MIVQFILINIEYIILTRIGHQHVVTTLLIEEFIRDYLLEKK